MTRLCVPIGLARKEEQLTPSQRCLAVRYVTQVCFYSPSWTRDSSTAILKVLLWDVVTGKASMVAAS